MCMTCAQADIVCLSPGKPFYIRSAALRDSFSGAVGASPVGVIPDWRTSPRKGVRRGGRLLGGHRAAALPPVVYLAPSIRVRPSEPTQRTLGSNLGCVVFYSLKPSKA